MKKLLLLVVLAMMTAGPTEAQKSKSPTIQAILEMPLPMPGSKAYPKPVIEKWTLVRSNTIAGFKCDHYEKDGKEVRVFKKDNGDFITLVEDPDGMSREPNSNAGTIGEWRLTLKTNIGELVLNGGFEDYYYNLADNNGYSIFHDAKKARKEGTSYLPKAQPTTSCRVTYPNGNAIGVIFDINWEVFKTGKLRRDYDGKQEVIPQPARANTNTSISGNEYYNAKNVIWYYPKEHSNMRFPYFRGNSQLPVGPGFIINGRVRAWEPSTQTVAQAIGQVVNNYVYPITDNDTIQSVVVRNSKEYEFEDLHEITYTNGDKIVAKVVDAGYYEIYQGSTLHRKDYTLTIKKSEESSVTTYRLNYPDGKFYVGSLARKGTPVGKKAERDDVTKGENGDYKLLCSNEVIPWVGDMELPEGKVEKVVLGLYGQQLAEAAAMEGPFDPSNPQSLAALKKRAEGGSGFANLAMAVIYYSGWGVQKNVAQAMKYIDKTLSCNEDLSASNDALAVKGAHLLRGVILYEGATGVTKNQAQAFKELEQNASHLYYLNNSKRALKFLFDKSKDKYTETITNKACRYLGICYEKGIGVTANLEYALSNWHNNSTDGESMYKMGYYTEQMRYKPLFVRGVKKPNNNVAREFYRIATDLGHAQAKTALQRLGN